MRSAVNIEKVKLFLENLKNLEKGSSVDFKGLDTTFQDLGEFLWFISNRFFVGNSNSCGLHIATIKDTEGTKELFYSEECLPKPAVFHFVKGFKIIETYATSQIEVKDESLKSLQDINIQKKEEQTFTFDINSTHPLVLLNGGLGILAGFAKVGKSTLLPYLLEEIISSYSGIYILFYTLDEEVIYTRRRLIAYPKVNSYPLFKLIDYEELFSRAQHKGFTFDLIVEEISALPQNSLKLVVLDNLRKIKELRILTETRASDEEKERNFIKIRQVLKSSKTTLLAVHHLTKATDRKWEEFKKIVYEEQLDIVNYFLTAVKGSSYLLENADYVAILIPNPAKPEAQRLFGILGRHLPKSLTLCYEAYFENNYDFPVIRKTESFSINPDLEDILKSSENLTFLQVLRERGTQRFSDVIEETMNRLRIPAGEKSKFLKKMWDRAFKIKGSFKNLGLIEKEGKLLQLTDLGTQLLKYYQNAKIC